MATLSETEPLRGQRPRWPRWRNGMLWLCLLAFVAGVLLLAHTWWARPLQIDWFFTRTTMQQLRDAPEAASTLPLTGAWQWLRENGRLQDRSAAAMAARQRHAVVTLATLQQYPLEKLSLAQQTNAAVMSAMLQRQVDGYAFRLHTLPVGLSSDTAEALPVTVLLQQPITSAADAQDYLQRLAAFPARAEQIQQQLQAADAQHIEPPRLFVDAVLQHLRESIGTAPQRHALYIDLQTKLLHVSDTEIAATERSALLGRAEATLRQHVYPAYQKLIDWYARQQPKVVRNDGAWALPDGERYYAYCIALHTGTSITAEELHTRGLTEVARLGAQMDALLQSFGATHGSVGMRMRALAATPTESKQSPSTGSRATRDLASGALLPRTPTPLPPQRMATPHAPLFRSMATFPAFTAGWPLYKQHIAAELKPEPTPTAQLRRLQTQMLAAVHQVVDTGMHARRWSREQSIAFAIDQTGISDSEATIAVEQDLAAPGSALAAGVGLMKFLQFRQQAQQRLGANFDAQQLEAALLRDGPVPWSVVERNLADYIAGAHRPTSTAN